MTPDVILADELKVSRTPQDRIRSLLRYLEAVDKNSSDFCASKGVTLACKSGCSFCCHLRVTARPHEVFAIAYVIFEWEPARLAELIQKLERHRDTTASMSKQQYIETNIACPLLQDGKCSVYSVRPFACRTYHSLDVGSCEYSFNNPADVDTCRPYNMEMHRLGLMMSVAAAEAFAKVGGYDARGYELGNALLEALTNPVCLRRWSRGKRPFIRTRSDE